MRFHRTLPIVLVLAAAAPLAAQGVIVPDCRDCRQPWQPGGRAMNALPIESVEIATRIEGQVATTHVTQVFRNETDATLEGTYFFPIPSGASVSEFAIWDGNRRLVGEVRPREEARRIYDAIVRRVRDPGLLEYAGENLFQASIFPILPRSTKKLELTYTQVLRAEGGTVGYRYPLGTGRNAAPIERVSGRIELRASEPVRTVYSPSHQVDVSRRDGDRRVSVSFESGRGGERRDFQLFYSPSAREVGMSLFTYREPGKDGYFLLLLSPRSTIEDREYASKDVVFVLDISGSMNEEGKMEKARRALVHGVNGLRATDRFNVIAFSGETRLMESGLIRADAAGRRRGVQFVEGLRAVGGTNINDALVEAMGQLPVQGTRPRLLVFLTDGLPTVGETNVENILTNVRRARREGIRLFSFGVGYDVNTRLLDRVAAENGGVADYVDPREDLEVKVSNFFDKVNHPVLTNLRLDLGPVRSDLVYPRELPDLFKGTQLALVGRYRNERDLAAVTLRLSGNASPTQTFVYPGQRFPLRDERHEWLPRLWATRRVGWLMEQVRSHGENRELREEIVELGTRYGIVTPYTSYLALEPGAEQQFSGMGAGTGAVLRRQEARGRPGVPPPPPPPPPSPTLADASAITGERAVAQSRSSRVMQDAVSLDAGVSPAEAGIRRVEARTFYLRSEVWTDSEIRDGTRLPETTVTFGTEEYFELLRRIPELGRYFSLGERVAVVHAGRIYRSQPANP
jgi:Ca-activated chloride channel homolog